MRGLTACLIVVSLALTNGAPPNAVSQESSSHEGTSFPKFDVDLPDIRAIFVHDEKYCVIFYEIACKQFYCRATFDSDGKTIMAATPLFGVYASSGVNFKRASKGLLINEYPLDGRVKLHFLPYADMFADQYDDKVLFSVSHGGWYGLSTEENKLGFCAFDDGKNIVNASKKVICQQYDAEGKTKLMEAEILIGQENHAESLKAFNLDKGLFVTMDKWEVNNDGRPILRTLFMYIDEHGKQGKPIDINVNCDSYNLVQTFYKNSIGEYCSTSICFNNGSESSRNSKCYKESELF